MAIPIHSTRGLGRLICDTRRQQGVTQEDLATKAGLTQATVSKIERGVSHANVATLFRLMSVLNLELCVIERDPTPPPAPWEEGS